MGNYMYIKTSAIEELAVELAQAKATIETLENEAKTRLKNDLKINNVIFSERATIVFWSDKTKTVVKAQKGDLFDHEKGVAMAYFKKMHPKDGYSQMNKYIPTFNNDVVARLNKEYIHLEVKWHNLIKMLKSEKINKLPKVHQELLWAQERVMCQYLLVLSKRLDLLEGREASHENKNWASSLRNQSR